MSSLQNSPSSLSSVLCHGVSLVLLPHFLPLLSALQRHWHPSISCLPALSSSPPPPHRSPLGSARSWFIFSSRAILRM